MDLSGFGVDETIAAAGAKFVFDRWWLLLTIFEINAGGKIGDFCGDFGLFKIVAYKEPSNGPKWNFSHGPCVCKEPTNEMNSKK